ncbi:hypothetical protein [Microcoleus sp. B5-C4]|uniref:hypothetical protein n=1 Tax=Microcoleus sp. B5-C4 TaxID=2818675 RepID=UPI002FCF2BAB
MPSSGSWMLARNWRESGLDLSSLTIASPVSFEEDDTGLVELAIAPEDEDKYPFVRPSSSCGFDGQTREGYWRMGEYGLRRANSG